MLASLVITSKSYEDRPSYENFVKAKYPISIIACPKYRKNVFLLVGSNTSVRSRAEVELILNYCCFLSKSYYIAEVTI